MAKSTNPNQDAEDTEYDNPGVEGQLQYPEVVVDAERAAAFAGGKVDSLEPEDDEEDE